MLISRLFFLLLGLTLGTLAACLLTGSAPGLWLGACAGVTCWFLLDHFRRPLRQQLRRKKPQPAPQASPDGVAALDITLRKHAEAMRRDFVANVSHEIRTPLTVLVGFVEILQSHSRSEEERQHCLTMMARQARRMQNLVDDLLALSRLEDSPPPDFTEWTPVHALLAHCEADARALSQTLTPKTAAPQQIVFPAVPAAAALAGVGKELFSAFSNLIANAVRYTPPGGRIEVRWTPLATGGAAFSVHDSGPGIPAKHIPRLTERFYRVDRSRAHETGGTGLGLSIVKHVLNRHNAVLRIESVFGHGATFIVEFPARCYRATEGGAQ